MTFEFPEAGEAQALADSLRDMLAGAPLDHGTLRRAANALQAVAHAPAALPNSAPAAWLDGDGGPDPLAGPPSPLGCSFEGAADGRQQVDCP